MTSKKLNLFLFCTLFISQTACSFAETKDCVDCSRKTIGAEVQPDKKPVVELKKAVSEPIAMAAKAPLVIAKSEPSRGPAGEKKIGSKDTYQYLYCEKFQGAREPIDVEFLLEEANEGPYKDSFNDFWVGHNCTASMLNTMKAPVIYNTANNPIKNVNFPQTIHEFLVEERKDPEAWLKMINTPTSEGHTFLDYLKFNFDNKNYQLKKTQDAANRIIEYICKNGGVYSKYKETAKCP